MILDIVFKGKYVFASRARRSSIEGRMINECIGSPNLLPPLGMTSTASEALHDEQQAGQVGVHAGHGGPILHYTTIPRKLKHVPKVSKYRRIY